MIYSYDSYGRKLRQVTSNCGSITLTEDNANNMIYKNVSLSKVLIPGGYIDISISQTSYHFFALDHLGNVRQVLGINGQQEEQNDYYPFGLRQKRSSYQLSDNKYKYNGKEQEELGSLTTLDYGTRMYDPALARWHVVDPLAEKYPNIAPYTYVANNPLRYIDPDGRKIVDATGKPITYTTQSGWSSNVTPDVRRIGTAMMLTPKGAEMFNKMLSSTHNISITIDPGEGDGTRNGYVSTKKSGDEIGSADILIYKGMAVKTINELKTVKEALEKGAKLTRTLNAETQALLDNVPKNADEFMANVAAHEAEHATNKPANAHFEPSLLKREEIANKTQIEVIIQTAIYRLEKTKSLFTLLTP
ncbi:MAG: RHS repeat-associated core domain-containing protein [Bacteroidales bacterium]|nr:RHS repeat-associated core domain-containing protein [Bacteroidales bacterium]